MTDIRFGLTRSGPHRDDLLISMRGGDGAARELRVFGSAGQQRTAAIALRLLEAAQLQERRGELAAGVGRPRTGEAVGHVQR